MFESGYIQTVTGKIKPTKLGITDAHDHVWIQKESNYKNTPSLFIDKFSLVKNGLLKFREAGGCSIIDCQPWGCGRNGNKLYLLSRETGVNIIAVTGFHKWEYYPKDSPMWKMNEKQASKFFIDEIRIGLEETQNSNNNIKAGLVKTAFIGKLEGQYLILTKAAIDAALMTNVPIIIHTEKGKNVEVLMKLLEKQSFPFSRVMLCHIDKRSDIDVHRLLAGKKVYLEYDTFLNLKYHPEKNVWPLINQMVEEGYHKQIIIGADMTRNYTLQESSNNPGLAGFFKEIINRMSESGISREIIQNMTSDNIARFLTSVH